MKRNGHAKRHVPHEARRLGLSEAGALIADLEGTMYEIAGIATGLFFLEESGRLDDDAVQMLSWLQMKTHEAAETLDEQIDDLRKAFGAHRALDADAGHNPISAGRALKTGGTSDDE